MATGKQTATNKKNAQKSTGPKSAEGKFASAKNATKHGLTTPPPQDAVLVWLRIILDDPQVSLASIEDDALGASVLRLAEAEARLERALDAERVAETALAKYAKTYRETDPFKLDLNDLDDPTVLEFLLKGEWEKGDKKGLKLLLAANINHPSNLAKRLARVGRYVRDAERQKSRALAEWQSEKMELNKMNPITPKG